MNNSTNQTDIFGNNLGGSQPNGNGNVGAYNGQMQGPQPMPQTQQGSVYQNQGFVEPMRVPNVPVQNQEQMGMYSNQGMGGYVYPNQYMGQGVQNGGVYTQNLNTPVQMQGQVVPNQTAPTNSNFQMNAIPSANLETPFGQQPVPNVENQEEVVMKPTESFTEMAFAGVNQQEEDAKKVTVLTSNLAPTKEALPVVEVPASENMQPVEKKADENAGLKFLGVIFFILIVVILCLPLIGLN